MQRFLDSLRRVASNDPRRKAFSFYRDGSVSEVSYGELVRDIERLANSTDAAHEGDLLLISSGTDYAGILGFLAALANDAHPAFLAPLTPRQDAGIFHAELAMLVQRFNPNRIVAETFDAARLHDGRFLEAFEPGFVQFSSGTTGLRKGVFVPEQKLIAQLESLSATIHAGAEDRIACWLPLYHDMGLITSLLLPLHLGCSVAFLDAVEWSYRPESLFTVITREASTLCWQPDFAFRHMVNRYARPGAPEDVSLRTLRLLVNCSEPCRVRTFEGFWNRFRAFDLGRESLQTCYAMAENVFAVTHSAFRGEWGAHGDAGFLSSGTPIRDTALRVAGQGAAHEAGEVEIHGRFLFDGYLRHAAPRQQLVDGWFRTGDIGYEKNGQLFVVGRIDDTLVVSGRKIVAHQLEERIGMEQGVRPGRVLCVADADGTGVDVYYEGAPLDRAAERNIRTWCATAAGVSVNRLRSVEAGTLVKSSSGKIARSKSVEKLARLKLS